MHTVAGQDPEVEPVGNFNTRTNSSLGFPENPHTVAAQSAKLAETSYCVDRATVEAARTETVFELLHMLRNHLIRSSRRSSVRMLTQFVHGLSKSTYGDSLIIASLVKGSCKARTSVFAAICGARKVATR